MVPETGAPIPRRAALGTQRYHLEHHLVPTLVGGRMRALTVDDIAAPLVRLRRCPRYFTIVKVTCLGLERWPVAFVATMTSV
jgi:hypothetical protein